VAELPSGTVTFLFTDLEDSTRLWEQHPDAMRIALARHDALVARAITSHDGSVVKTTGDGFHAVFSTAEAAIRAAIDAQVALSTESWDVIGLMRVRMGLHTGTADLRDGDYYGSVLNRAARLMSVAHGGQIVCSQTTEELLRDAPVTGLELRDLGHHRLRGLSRPERIFQVIAPGLTEEFPALRTGEARRSNLPLQLTTFVGRVDDVRALCDLLGQQRLVTLVGVGGVGKTRLAIEVARLIEAATRDGASFFELAPVADEAGLVVAASRRSTGVARARQLRTAARSHRRPRG
jgi:class 3 adenylate cyclase